MEQIPNTQKTYFCDENGNVYDENRQKQTISEDDNGYLVTTIDGVPTPIHQLVAITFISNPRNYPQVNHINSNKKDNRVLNLEWVSAKEGHAKPQKDTKTKVADINAGANAVPVKATHLETGAATIYKSVDEASRALNIDQENIRKCLIGEIKNAGGYRFEKTFLSCVYNVFPVPIEQVHANSYNPNVVPGPEFYLLYQSIKEDGYTQPVVCYRREDGEYEIVDGYHRYSVMKVYPDIYEREHGLLPVVLINKDLSNRMASTIRHNRARGSHSVELMAHIIKELVASGMSDAWIKKNIGMDADEILRLKQLNGLAALFHDREFSSSWDIDEKK